MASSVAQPIPRWLAAILIVGAALNLCILGLELMSPTVNWSRVAGSITTAAMLLYLALLIFTDDQPFPAWARALACVAAVAVAATNLAVKVADMKPATDRQAFGLETQTIILSAASVPMILVLALVFERRRKGLPMALGKWDVAASPRARLGIFLGTAAFVVVLLQFLQWLV